MKADPYLHRFGLNYTPSRNWYYCWNDFQAESIARDLDSIASLHADHIRLMIIWPWFQPNPACVSMAHLQRLGIVFDLAAERNLDVCLCVLTGHLSGFQFKPPFEKRDSLYSSPNMLKAQDLLFRELATLANHKPNFLGFDLGNEMNCCWMSSSLREGDEWMKGKLAMLRELSPAAIHGNGVDHNPWFSPHCFSPQVLAESQTIIPLHSWIFFTGAMERGGPLDLPSTTLCATMAKLARAYAGLGNKPVWIQEYGASEAWMAPSDIPTFLEQSTRFAIEQGVSWITWWCSHDLDPKFHFNPLEYSLGLFKTDQTPKPQAAIFREFAQAYSGKPVSFRNLHAEEPIKPPDTHTHEATWQWLLNAMPR